MTDFVVGGDEVNSANGYSDFGESDDEDIGSVDISNLPRTLLLPSVQSLKMEQTLRTNKTMKDSRKTRKRVTETKKQTGRS